MSRESASVIRYDEKSFFINGKRVLLFGGEFHYFRVPHGLWEDRIRKMKLGGCNFVSTYIPWNFHEWEEGNVRWDGDRDLGKFLRLCEKYGLYVILKPGPYICAEWDFGGFPDWLLSKDIELRTYDEQYLGLVKHWFTEIAKVVKPHLITNGGKVILFQVENEYDHYLFMGDVRIPEEIAKKYMFKLMQLVKEAGIDVPPFTNEGALVRGSEIIETRTYYPNIPWIWLWEFNDFDNKIEATKKQQPGKPTLILELQAGWFDQFGQPLCKIGLNVLDSIMRNVLAHGASLLNLYMYTGGTTFPYWFCRGDALVQPAGIGNTTTYDFGVSPIREWGDLEAEKYYAARAVSRLMESFPELFTGTEEAYDKVKFVEGGCDIAQLTESGAAADEGFVKKTVNVKALSRPGKNGSLVMIRNLEPRSYDVAVEFNYNGRKTRIPGSGTVELPAYTTRLLPVGVAIPGTEWKIAWSTSELLTAKKINGKTSVFVYGDNGSRGELMLESASGKKKLLKYVHSGVKVMPAGDINVVALDKFLSGRLWDLFDGAGVSTFDFIQQAAGAASRDAFKVMVKAGAEQESSFFLRSKPKRITVGGKAVPVKWDKVSGAASFRYKLGEKPESACRLKWEGDWRYKSDAAEAMPDHDDSKWRVLPEPISLEKAGIIGHGWYWYRAEVELDKVNGTADLEFDSGGMDRMYLYVNGNFVWKGIGKSCRNIAAHLKPGKNVIAVRYENAFHTKAHPHEGAVKKYSGIQKPFVLKDAYGNSRQIKKFKVKYNLGGIDKGFHKAGFDDSKWKKAAPAQRFTADESLGSLLWLRRGFSYEKKDGWQAPVKLTIPKAEERCMIYLNGQALGKYESLGPQTEFYVPETMLEKDNVLAIVLEGPGFHNVLQGGFNPPYIEEPQLSTWYAAKETDMVIDYGGK